MLLLPLVLAWPATAMGDVSASAIPGRTDRTGAATPSPQIPRVDPLDALAGPPSSQFT